MAYDPATGNMVLFGGSSGSNNFDDTWTWNGINWSQLSPATSPPGRSAASMAYDPATGNLVLFGGVSDQAYDFNDTWTWNGTTWDNVVPNGASGSPPSLSQASMAYDPATGNMVLFGGVGYGTVGETWTWNGINWSQLSPATSPTARYGASMAYDPATGNMVLFGGEDLSGNALSDTWLWNGTTWAQASPAISPSARYFASMAYDPATENMVLFGGEDNNGTVEDTWLWNGTTWAQASPAINPSGGVSASMAYDPTTGNMVLFGGYGGVGVFFGDTWVYGNSVADYLESVAVAGAAITYEEASGGGAGGSTQCGCAGGEPVNLATGDFYDTKTYLSVPGPGVPLNFTATYDAVQAQQSASSTTLPPPGPLGYGWNDNFSASLSDNTTTNIVTLTNGNGSQVPFNYDPIGASENSWCPSDANNAIYCPVAPRFLYSLAEKTNSNTNTWTLIQETSTPLTFVFTSTGSLGTTAVLSEIMDAQGNTLTEATYSPQSGQPPCPSADTCTAWTSSGSSRSIVLANTTATSTTTPTLNEVFSPQSGQVVTFSYTGTGCSTWALGDPVDLCSVTLPGSLTTSFTYSSSNTNIGFAYDELTMTPPGGTGDLTNTYNPNGQIATQIIGTQPNQQDLGFSYGIDSSLSGGTTTTETSYPNGVASSITYYFSNLVLVGKTDANGVTDYFYPSLTILRDTRSVDGNGNATTTQYPTSSSGADYSVANPLLVTDAMGNKTQYAYTPDNQVWCKVDPSDYLNGVRCPSSEPSMPAAGSGKSTAALGATITYYDPVGHAIRTTDALGYTSATAYNSSGQVYCSVDAYEYSTMGVNCPSTPPTSPPTGVSGYTTNIYTSNGDLASSTTPGGATTSYCYYYETSTCASSATESNDGGNSTLLYLRTGPNGTTTTYTYNQAGQVTDSIVSFGSGGANNHYQAQSITAYDSSGRPYCTESAYDVGLDITFNGSNAIYPFNCPSPAPTSPPTPGTDPWEGANVTIYNLAGQVADTVSSIGGVTQYAYDQAGNKFCTLGPSAYAAGKTCPTSPPSTPPTQGSDPYPGATITTYNALGQAIEVTDPTGAITLNTYDQAGNLTQTQVEATTATTNAPTVTTAYTYNADNQQTSTTLDPGGSLASTTSEEYDPNGNVYCSVSGNAVATGMASTTDPSGYQCPAWQPSWINSPPTPSSLYSTTPSSSQANDVTTSFYNADSNLVQSTNPDVYTTAYAYDANGRQFCQLDPVNFESGTRCPTTPPASPPTTTTTGYTTTLYNQAGEKSSVTDPVGNTTTYTYSPSGLELTATVGAGSSSQQVTTTCYYFEASTCASGAPAGGGSGSMVYSTTAPSGELTTNTYFPGGSLEAQTNPAGTINKLYYANGETYETNYSNTATGYQTPPNVMKTYYQDGSLDTVTDGTGTTTYTYDFAGDMTSQALASSSPSGFSLNNQTITYNYYRPGNIASIVYPNYTGASGSVTNPTATYTYDATGQMASVTDWSGNTVKFTHDLNGNITAQNNPGPVNTTFSYDPANLMSEATTTVNASTSGISPQVTSSPTTSSTSPTTQAMEKYFGSTLSTSSTCTPTLATITQNFGTGQSPGTGSYNQDGQVTQYHQQYKDNCKNTLNYQRDYSYNQAGQLTFQGSAPQGTANFAYDPTNDPTLLSSHDSNGSFDTYNQVFNSGGQVTSETPISGSNGGTYNYTYNSIGALSNSVSGGYNLSYGYDILGQMTSNSFFSTTNYLYNAAGLEAAYSTGNASIDTTQFTWGNLGGLPLLLSDSKDYFIYGPGTTPVEQYNVTSSPPSSNPTFLTYFKPSDSWLVTNTSGQVTNAAGYDATGNLSNGSPGTIFGYQGQFQGTPDNSTGWVNMRARWYDTQSGMFTSQDPALTTTNAPYQYANGDPVNNSDPSGLMTMGICGTAQAAAGWGLGAGLTGTVCIVHTILGQADEWGITETGGFTGVAAGAFAGAAVVMQVSTAQHLVGLKGGFYNVSGAINGGCSPGASADVFWGPTRRGSRVVGGDVGVGFGCGDGAAPFFTVTYVQVAHNSWAKGGLEAIWAIIAPETVPGNIASQLFDAARSDSSSQGRNRRRHC